jgi:hypothetical protein
MGEDANAQGIQYKSMVMLNGILMIIGTTKSKIIKQKPDLPLLWRGIEGEVKNYLL